MKNSIHIKTSLIVYFLFSGLAVAQKKMPPLQEDFQTISGIIDSAYNLISGEVGTIRQTEKVKSLYTSNGIISKSVIKQGIPDREIMTVEEFYYGIEKIREYSFFEEEVNREVRIFGTIATVWSTFQIRNEKNGPIVKRGINNIHLHFKEDRWWILSWSWDYEEEGKKIPASFDKY